MNLPKKLKPNNSHSNKFNSLQHSLLLFFWQILTKSKSGQNFRLLGFLTSFLFLILFKPTAAGAVSIQLDGTSTLISGTDCNIATYRFGTPTTYEGQALDILVEVLAEENDLLDQNPNGEYCITPNNNSITVNIADRQADNNTFAFMDLKITVVAQGTTTPVEVDRLAISAFDLDINNPAVGGSDTDDVYFFNPDGAYLSNVTNVIPSTGNFFGGQYNIKLKGQSGGNCSDTPGAASDPTCRGGGIFVNGDNGINTVSSVRLRVQNDDAFSTRTNNTSLRKFQLSLEIGQLEELITNNTDFGDADSSYGSAGTSVSTNLSLGNGVIPDNEVADQVSANATGDDTDAVSATDFDDEDGVRLNNQPLDNQSLQADNTTSLDITTFGTGFLSSWLDINGDGDFSDPGEQVVDDIAITSTTVTTTSVPVTVPAAAIAGNTKMRFRFSETENEAATGLVSNGEVEDYQVAIAAPLITGNVCYTVADSGDTLTQVDIFTGAEASIGNTGTSNIEAIAYWPITNTLYATNAGTFGTINTGTGTFSPIGAAGSGSGSAGVKNFNDIDGLTVHPYTGQVFGSVRDGDGSAPADLLIEINPATGSHVPNAFGTGIDYVVIQPQNSLHDIDDITIDPDDGQLYGVANQGGNVNNQRYVRINRTDGTTELVGLFGFADVEGLTAFNNGNIYMTTGTGGGSTSNTFYRVNKSSGQASTVGALSVGSDYESVACLTGPPNAISGKVFLDSNNNGTNDNESGTSDVTVKLYRDVNQNGTVDAGDLLLTTQNTDSNGDYNFLFAATGPYLLEIDTTTLPTGSILTTDNLEVANLNGLGLSDDNNNFGRSNSLDYGDAPEDLSLIDASLNPAYPTNNANNGARHNINNTIYLGSGIDSETDGQPSVDADADNDDGVIFPTAGTDPILIVNEDNTITVEASIAGVLNAWIDWNQDGDWDDTGEQIADNEALIAGSNSLTINPDVDVPHGQTYARFRFSSQSDLEPTGIANDGEVEDYAVHLLVKKPDGCNPVLINHDFESLAVGESFRISGGTGVNFSIYREAQTPGWSFRSTNPSSGNSFDQRNSIELWRDGFQTVPAFEGDQFSEINAFVFGNLYQDINTTPDSVLRWRFAHRGRDGDDTIQVNIGSPDAMVSQGQFTTGNNEWKVYSGLYTVPSGQEITRIEFEAVSSASGNSSIGNFVDDISFRINNNCFRPELVLVKRITAINPESQTDQRLFNTFNEDGIPNNGDNDPNWPNDNDTYLPGQTDVSDVKPGDEVEYTIYFLSSGDIDANQIKICDVIPDDMTFVKNTYGNEVGIGLDLTTANPPTSNPPSEQLSNLIGDEVGSNQGAFYAPGTTPPAMCDKIDPNDTSSTPVLIDVNNNNNISGAVWVKLEDGLSPATVPGNPIGSYGFVRFRTKVK